MKESTPPAHVYRLTIKEHHLDTFGHVNNATYLQLFEEARWEWITSNGYGIDEIQRSGLGPVVLELSVKFRREVVLRQELSIESRHINYKGKLFRLRQEMVGGGGDGSIAGTTHCTAEFLFGLFDLQSRKLVAPTAKWFRALDLPVPLESL